MSWFMAIPKAEVYGRRVEVYERSIAVYSVSPCLCVQKVQRCTF